VRQQLTVRCKVDLFRQFRYVHFKPFLYVVQHLGIRLVRDERNSEALRAKPTSACHLSINGIYYITISDAQTEDILQHNTPNVPKLNAKFNLTSTTPHLFSTCPKSNRFASTRC